MHVRLAPAGRHAHAGRGARATSAFQEPPQPDRDRLTAVQSILAPVKDKPWPSELPENN